MNFHRLIFKLATYPLTIATLLLVVASEWFFFIWFSPGSLVWLAMLLIGVVFEIGWLVVLINSSDFKRYFNRTRNDIEAKDFKSLLPECNEKFKAHVESCLQLISEIEEEFESEMMQSDIDSFLMSLWDLTKKHSVLFVRYMAFGTDSQKKIMKKEIELQIKTVEQTLEALKAISGNRAILENRTDEQNTLERKIKDISDEIKNATMET